MSSPPAQTQSSPIEDFLATVLGVAQFKASYSRYNIFLWRCKSFLLQKLL